MEVKALAVGNTQVKNNVFLAPIAGYTDYCFRKPALKQGFGLCGGYPFAKTQATGGG